MKTNLLKYGMIIGLILVSMMPLVAPAATADWNNVSRFISNIRNQTDVPLLISGNKENFSDVELNDKVIGIKAPEELIDYLQNMA